MWNTPAVQSTRAIAEGAEIAAEAALPGFRDDLLQIGIADEEVLQEAGLGGVGAGKLGGRWRAVGLGISAINREVRR